GFVEEPDVDIGGRRGDDDFHRLVDDHHPRHAAWQAAHLRIVGLSAARLVREVGFPDRLVLGCERRLLRPARALAGVERPAADTPPLAAPVRVFAGVLPPPAPPPQACPPPPPARRDPRWIAHGCPLSAPRRH